ETEHSMDQDMFSNEDSRISSSSFSGMHMCLMANGSKVSPTLTPNTSSNDESDDDDNDEEYNTLVHNMAMIYASLHEEIKELEAQVLSLKKDLEKRHEGKSALDKMLSVQQSPNDKSGLGFNSNNKNKSKSKSNKKKGQDKVKDPAKLVCFKCKVEGHHVRSCPLKKKKKHLSEKQQGKRPQGKGQAHARPQVEDRPLPKKNQDIVPQEKKSIKKRKGNTCYLCHMASPINFNQFLEKEKLKSNGSNFTDWFRHVRIFLNGGNLQYVLDAPLGDPPAETETDEVKNVYATRKTRYKNFVMNYNMQNMNKELPELFSMLKSAEIEIKKEHQVLMVNKTTSFKKQGKSKGKFKKGGKKAATPPVKPKTSPKPDAECYYCKEKGHWKRNCSKYLADLKSGLVKKKKEVTMRVGNGSKVDVIAVGTLPLHLPSGLVLSLNNCYFVPALSMNIISGSCLMQDAPEKNGLFLLDLDSSDTHIHNIDAKRIKLNDNSTYMWHCRLGHIGVKRMKKLHTDGLLESLEFESLDRCEACLMGKMTKTPFSGIMERATDLLEIIHTDVCGPMSVASRGGYRYVLTFTDDLSRYGYIYFMKHKSETFKEFQSEVENQRNKKIKFLRSDRGGEYLSYEFGMHLKKCGILSQLTPPGTPQRNGVSERRNRTLLDMKPKLSFLKVWGCEAYVKKLQPDKLEPKAEKCVFIGYPKETIGYTFYHRSEGKIFVAKNGTFLEKEFLTKEVTGRKVELDEIDESSLIDQSSAVPEDVPVPPTPSTEEANDDDHETSNEIATEPRRSTRE
ncbi:hypothetical protein QYE76_007384, partial [Lolium multiflorum]